MEYDLLMIGHVMELIDEQTLHVEQIIYIEIGEIKIVIVI
jgi:hypothetical protein